MGRIPFQNPHERVRLLFVGAHPDDADLRCGGTAIRFLQEGHVVTFLSMTDGSCGHQEQSGTLLAERRQCEAERVASFLGLRYLVLDTPDAHLQATVENRDRLIRIIRDFQPSLIITHRPNDYHTDHRHTSLLVQDAAYLVCVPNVCPDSPRLSYNPVILYAEDDFRKPGPFRPDVLVDISAVYEKKMQAAALHESQMFEWLPFIENYPVPLPADPAGRLEWLKRFRGAGTAAGRFRRLLEARLSPAELASVEHVEAFEACEYGGALSAQNVTGLFPFGISLLEEPG